MVFNAAIIKAITRERRIYLYELMRIVGPKSLCSKIPNWVQIFWFVR